jgi:uncharacterized protein
MSKTTAVLSLALCMIAAGTSAQAQELTRQAKIERILDLMNTEASVNQMLDQVIGTMTSQMKTAMPNATPEQLAQAQEMQNKMMELVKSRMSWAKMRVEYSRIYGEIYSDEEINGMLAFYESPAGRGYLQKMPLMVQKTMAISQTQMGDLMPDIQRIVRESMPKKQ